MLQMAFYWSLLVTQFTDVKRKDFWEMFIHHMTTIANFHTAPRPRAGGGGTSPQWQAACDSGATDTSSKYALPTWFRRMQ